MYRELSLKLLMNFLFDFLITKLKSNLPLKPLFFTHYLTLRCNLRCNYCNFSNSSPFDREFKALNTEDTISLMKIIYKEIPYIYFTGGEPLLRHDVMQILKYCKKIGFKSITINTNMSLIHKKPEVLDHVTNLVASLDMIDEDTYSNILGVPLATVSQIKNNIIECSKLQEKKKFKMTINCVVTPETIVNTIQVMDFCFTNNIRFAVVPAVCDRSGINRALKNSEEYRRLILHIINEKSKGKPVFGTYEYLHTILNFKEFDCYPLLTPHTYPDGALFYPCEPLKKYHVNLLSIGSYKDALNKFSHISFHTEECKGGCHKACYIEPSCYINNPLSLLKENV